VPRKKKPTPKGKPKRKNLTTRKVQATEKKPYVVPDVECKPEEDNDPCGDDGLTTKQRSFVSAITGPAIGNATKAAEMAGYASENRKSLWATASRTLSMVKVQEAISHAWARKRNNPEWTRNQIIESASISMSNFLTIGEDGDPITDFNKAAAMGAIGQIREIEQTVLDDGEGGRPKILKFKFKLHDRTAAQALLAKMQGLVNDSPAERANDLPLEEHPATGKVAPASGTAEIHDKSKEVPDSAGGA